MSRPSIVPHSTDNYDARSGAAPAAIPERDKVDLSIVQQALYGDEFELTEVQRQLADLYIKTGNMRTVGHKLRPDTKRGVAYQWARRILLKPEVVAYMKWRRAQMLLRTAVTDAELIEMERRVYLHATGRAKINKTVVSTSPETGETIATDLEVYDPSLPTANAAVETMRKIAGIGLERKEVNVNATLADLSLEEKRKKFEELLAANSVLVEGEVVDDD